MELKTQNWKEFRICDLFEKNNIVKYSSTPESIGTVPFISSTSINNGVSHFCDETPNITSSCLTVSTNGNCFDCFYHNEAICVSNDVEVLVNKSLSCYQMLFICTVLKQESEKYSYGRKAKNDKVWQTIIKLPAKRVINETEKSIYEPDWQFMEDYIKSLRYKLPETQIQKNQSMTLDVTSWKEFRLGDLFDVQGTTTTKVDTLTEEYGIGEHPYITTQATNNGTAGYYNYYTENGNVLVADSAVVGYVSYQPKCFSASDHVEKLMPKFEMNKYNALFLVTVLNRENYRYSYGRKFNQTNIKNTIIKLPSQSVPDEIGKSSSEPDWQFMEDYIKSLPCSDLI
jgi:hypothetical protein